MKKIKNFLLLSTLISLVAISVSSCVKKEFDEPVTANLDPVGVVATHTIAQLQVAYDQQGSSLPLLIDSNVIISGIIIADDESGNFYKEIVIEDSTGGLAFQVDVTNFNTNYPIGRRVFIKCNGLYFANDGDGNYQIGFKDGSQVARVPQSLYEQYLLKGMWGFNPTPTVTTISNLGNLSTNTLVQFNDVEFDLADAGAPFADALNLISKNATIQECTGSSTLTFRTSGFAKFASDLTPTGKGTIIGIYQTFGSTKQILIRNTGDLQMSNVRCDGSSGPSGNETIMPIDSLRMLYPASATGPNERKIRGTVISDLTTEHTDYRNLVIQDATGGITVRLPVANTFTRGQVVDVVVSGLALSEFNSLLQIEAPPLNISVVGSATEVPVVITIANLLANFEKYESALVEIQNVTFMGNGIYDSNDSITDGTGNIILFTRGAATYSGQTYPTTQVSKVKAIVSQYKSSTTIGQGYQLILRKPSYDITL